MICQTVSGIILSKSLFTFLNIRIGQGIARTAHMIGSYWGFVIMSLHLGLHWNVMMKKLKIRNAFVRMLLPILGYMMAIYGVYAFIKRGIFAYLLLINQFVYYDYSEPLIFYLFDYMAVMGSFVYLGNLIASELKGGKKR